MFGGTHSSGPRGTVKYKGEDLHTELALSLKDVYTTQKRTLSVLGKNIRITVPAGVENGQLIKLKGHGGAGVNGGPNGDLYIKFKINNNSSFKRNKSDLHTQLNIDLYEAVLGGEIQIETFDGKVSLKIAPGTQNGAQVKLKGKGFAKYKHEGQYGDLIVTYHVKIPTNLNEKEIDLFQQLKQAGE